jgi:pimeloyl-ACP methyl ester carboxylesterase
MSLIERVVPLSDGRTVAVLIGDGESARALLCHHGTPSDGTIWSGWDGVAGAHDLRLVALTRPGYAGSTRQPGRTVASAARDVAEVLDALGVDDFVTTGWSGGGPHALACAALLPKRCRAVALLASIAPFDARGLAWFDGMGPENIDELGAAARGEDAIRAWLTTNAEGLRNVDADDVAELLGGLASEVDKAALSAGFARTLASSMRRALAPGFDGWIDDDLALLSPWGFELASITVPVAVWQGDADFMVPFAHGRWLAANVPGAEERLAPGHGHISLAATFRDDILRQLVRSLIT